VREGIELNSLQAQPASASPRAVEAQGRTFPTLTGLAIGVAALVLSAVLSLLFTSAAFGYPAGGLA
jgi:hypothetical protein